MHAPFSSSVTVFAANLPGRNGVESNFGSMRQSSEKSSVTSAALASDNTSRFAASAAGFSCLNVRRFAVSKKSIVSFEIR